MQFQKIVFCSAFALSLSGALPAFADDAKDSSFTEEAKETGRDIKKGTKKVVRNVKDKTCEMINGKLECAAQKVKNKAKNVGDEIKDKTNTD